MAYIPHRWVVACLAIAALAVAPEALRAQGDSLITRITGTVQVMPAGTTEWKTATLNQPVTIGDAVRTLDDSVCEVRLAGGATLNLEENTEVSIPKDTANTARQVGKVEVPAGGVWTTFKKLFQSQSFDVDTKNAVGGVHGTIFYTDVNPQTGAADWSLLEGKIALTPARPGAKTLYLPPGLRATVAKDMLVHKVKRFDVVNLRQELNQIRQGISIKRLFRIKLPARGRAGALWQGLRSLGTQGAGHAGESRPGTDTTGRSRAGSSAVRRPFNFGRTGHRVAPGAVNRRPGEPQPR